MTAADTPTGRPQPWAAAGEPAHGSGPGPTQAGFPRRTVLALGALAGAVAVSGPLAGPAAAATVDSTPRRWTAGRTQNGWPVVEGAPVATFRVQGSGVTTALRSGPVATVLLHVVRRWHYEIADLGARDVLGHTVERTVAAAMESNHLSGTAIAIRPGAYPIGSAGNLYGPELLIVRDILAECEGVVRWGGDSTAGPKEGHFQIDVGPRDRALTRVAAKIDDWDAAAGRGAGTPVELASETRLTAARSLARYQST